MSAAVSLPNASADLALQLHALLRQTDPARFRPERDQTVRPRLEALRDALAALLAHVEPRGAFASLHAALQRALDLLSHHLPAPNLDRRQARRAWAALWKELQQAYGELSASLEAWDIHVPALRPTNYARNVFHMANAAVAITVLGLFPRQEVLLSIAGGFFAFAWTAEASRRVIPRVNDVLMWLLGPVAHPHESHRVNSATWFCTSLFLLALSDALTASVVALAVLGFGDPCAAVVGRRWGRTRLVNGRSLEGSLAFLAAGAGIGWLALWLTHPEIAPHVAALTALAGGFAGMLAELFSRRVDDNLSIPLTAAAAAAATLAVFGVPV